MSTVQRDIRLSRALAGLVGKQLVSVEVADGDDSAVALHFGDGAEIVLLASVRRERGDTKPYLAVDVAGQPVQMGLGF